MNIALIGATGFVGATVLAELLQRGHAVTALVRMPSSPPSTPAGPPPTCTPHSWLAAPPLNAAWKRVA
jgi:uncharacterized protein YbjT (DUF2867 family)